MDNSMGIGFTPSLSDLCVYTDGGNNTFAVLSINVDDTLIPGRNKDVMQNHKKALQGRFAKNSMGEVGLIRGVAVTRDYKQGKLTITHKQYVQGTFEQFEMLDSRATHTSSDGPELSNKKPAGVHKAIARRLPRYLKGHPDLGTTYKRRHARLHLKNAHSSLPGGVSAYLPEVATVVLGPPEHHRLESQSFLLMLPGCHHQGSQRIFDWGR